MKIAFLTSEYPHPKTGDSGGIGTSIKNLAAGLAKEGAAVSILVYGQQQGEIFTDNGLTIYRIKNIRLKGFSRFLTQKKIEKLINTLVKEQKVEIVEAPDWTGITSFIKPHCPVVVKLHGSDTYFCHLDKRPVKWINNFHEKRALKNADALVSVSRYTADITAELFGLKSQFTIIPNGIDMAQFNRGNDEVDKSVNTIFYFGTLIRKKGLLELPLIFNEVFKRNNTVKLILAGRDATDIATRNTSVWQMMQPLFSEGAFKNVTWLGSVPNHQIKQHINNATVCVFPTFAEALPVSWIEAMAMQKGIVASDIGWAKELIDDGIDGFLVHPQNHTQYANRILELLDDRHLRNQMGVEARKKCEHLFNMTVVSRQNMSFYKSLLKNNEKKD